MEFSFTKIPWNFRKFHGISQKIPWNFENSMEFSENSMELLKNSMEFSKNSMEFLENSMECSLLLGKTVYLFEPLYYDLLLTSQSKVPNGFYIEMFASLS